MAETPPNRTLSLWQTVALLAPGLVAFHLAYSFPKCAFLIAIYLYSLTSLARQRTPRRAFYFGLATGLLAYGPQLSCFYTIFGPAAIALWSVLAFWVGVFGLMARGLFNHFGPRYAIMLLPLIWTGLEYFRSELYYLRFSWLNAGYAFASQTGTMPFTWVGVYGVGFCLMLLAAACHFIPLLQGERQRPSQPDLTAPVGHLSRFRWSSQKGVVAFNFVALAALGLWTNLLPGSLPLEPGTGLIVAGVQMEFPGEAQVYVALSKLKRQFPSARLLMLSEYTFTESLPDKLGKWCRDNERYLVVGGKELLGETNFFDTAFVIDPKGKIVFRQVKSVPIQFFKDGLPARDQRIWESPWGKIGICICYDLSYTKVTDQLVRLGAQAVLVPTMDVVEWGRHQHELHARIAPVRSAEYGLPIFRVASSGISQLVNAQGTVTASAPFPGEDATLAGELVMAKAGRIPLDRPLARASSWLTGLLAGWLALDALRKRLLR